MTLMTEDEARTKWCPFVRVPVGSDPVEGNHASNRYFNGALDSGGAHNCIASDCMAWRWALKTKIAGDSAFDVEDKTRGRCGLAGEPK